MTVTEALDQLRNAHASVETLVYVDLKAEMVLFANGDASRPQEANDALLSEARAIFSQGGSADRMAAIGDDDRADARVICADKRGLRMFVRSAENADEGLCILCRDADGLPALGQAASEALARCASDEGQDEA